MPLFDYYCRSCGASQDDVYRSIDVGGRANPPTCDCGERMEVVIAIGAMDAGNGGFRSFDVDVDGTRTSIDSLHTLRRVERESEQRYRNGEGEPLRFRMWNQDRSNKDVGAFGHAGTIGDRTYGDGQGPAPKNPRIDLRRHGTEKPKVTVVPGHGRSALKG